MQALAFGVDGRQDKRRIDAARQADRPEDVGIGVTVVANHGRARSERHPDVAQRSFLADASLILKPDFERSRGSRAKQHLPQAAFEVF